MLINIKNETSENTKYIESSSIILMHIMNMQKWNENAAVKKYKHKGAEYIIEAETKNNIITNDRIISNGFPAYSFDSETIDIYYGTESECLDTLENIQSQLNWLKAESPSDIIPHGYYINPSYIIYLNIYGQSNNRYKPNTHSIECVLNHKYISSIQDFIPIEFRLDRLLNLEKSVEQIIETPRSITMFLMHIKDKFESIMTHKKIRLFTGSEEDCKRKLAETIDFLK